MRNTRTGWPTDTELFLGKHKSSSVEVSICEEKCIIYINRDIVRRQIVGKFFIVYSQ